MPSQIETSEYINAYFLANPSPPTIPTQPSYINVVKHCVEQRTAPVKEPSRMFADVKPGMEGINRLEAIFRRVDQVERNCLPNNGKFTKNQWIMIKDVIAATLPQIVTVPEYVRNRQIFLDYLQIKFDSRFAGVLGARQIGKTTCVAAVVTAILLECPDVTIGLYASKLEQATILQMRVVEFIHRLGKKIHVNMSDNLITFYHSSKSTTTVRAYSMNTVVRSSIFISV